MTLFYSHLKTNAQFLAFAVGLQLLVYANPNIQSVVKQVADTVVVAKAPASAAVVAPNAMQTLASRIRAQIESIRQPYGMKVVETAEGLEIQFSVAPIFKAGSVTVQQSQRDLLIMLFESFKLQTQDVNVKIEVHTDPSPVVRAKNSFATNEALTQARAEALAEIFKGFGFPVERLSATGKGDRVPLLKFERGLANATFDELIRHRRAIIYISK